MYRSKEDNFGFKHQESLLIEEKMTIFFLLKHSYLCDKVYLNVIFNQSFSGLRSLAII